MTLQVICGLIASMQRSANCSTYPLTPFRIRPYETHRIVGPELARGLLWSCDQSNTWRSIL